LLSVVVFEWKIVRKIFVTHRRLMAGLIKKAVSGI
jgi:hypothetical protein